VAGVTVDVPSDRDAALAWFAAEHANLRAVLRYAASTGRDTYVGRLVPAFTDFLDLQGYWSDWADMQQVALAAAERLGDPAAHALAHRGLGRAYLRMNRMDEAVAQLGTTGTASPPA